MSAPPGIVAAAEAAVALIEEGARVGLGSGRASAAFVERLAARVHAGLSVECVATSEAAARQARAAGLRLIELGEAPPLDITVDGADEVAPNLNLVKGRGGAFVRERIVAAASRRQVIVVGPEKLVEALGATGPIPIEIIPMALGFCTRRLKELGVRPVPRTDPGTGRVFISDNGNLVVDVTLAATLLNAPAARAFDAEVRSIPGVVDTGLFLATAERVLVGYPNGRVDTRWPQHETARSSH
jgi:ribose 5-phosphate isomerase A